MKDANRMKYLLTNYIKSLRESSLNST